MESSRIPLVFKQAILPFLRRRAFLRDMSALLLGVLFARVEILQAVMPFGAALLVGADMAGITVYFPFFGLIAGALMAGEAGIPSCAFAALYLLVRLCYPLIAKRLLRLDKLLAAGASLSVMLLIFYIGSWADFFKGLSGVAFTLLLAIAFQNALRAIEGIPVRQRFHEEEQIAICLLSGTIALSLSGVSAYAFSLGLVAVVWVSIFTALVKGLPAVAASVTLGVMMLLCGKVQPLLIADLALCTLAAVVARNLGAWGAAAGFLICAGVTEAYFGVAGQRIGLVNAIPAAALLVFIPKRGMLFLRSMMDSSAREERTARAMLKRMQMNVADDIAAAASTVYDVADLFPAEAEWAHDIAKERMDIRRACQNICAGCSYRGACWREEDAALDAVEAMQAQHAQGVRPRAGEPLKSDCQHTAAIAAAAIQARDAYREKCTQAYHDSMRQAFVSRHLRGVGGVMKNLSTDIRECGWPDESTAHVLKRRLERDGVVVKGALVRQARHALRVELRLMRGVTEQRAEEMVFRALERPMRVLSMRETARECIITLESAQRMRTESGAATLPKRGSPLSGDSTGQTSLPNGHMLYVLSDGMGTGAAARDQSTAAVGLLMRLYSIGYDRDVSLECVNRLLMNKGEADMYATLDALHIDLRDGHAEFIKCGAPPSFVLRDGAVHTIYAEALPAGVLDEAMPAVHGATLRRNDVVVLLTDGVLDALGEDTKEEILLCAGGANTCEDAAQALLEAARARDASDDMTVYVVRLE